MYHQPILQLPKKSGVAFQFLFRFSVSVLVFFWICACHLHNPFVLCQYVDISRGTSVLFLIQRSYFLSVLVVSVIILLTVVILIHHLLTMEYFTTYKCQGMQEYLWKQGRRMVTIVDPHIAVSYCMNEINVLARSGLVRYENIPIYATPLVCFNDPWVVLSLIHISSTFSPRAIFFTLQFPPPPLFLTN